MEKLSVIARELVTIEGACAAGISTVETLRDGPATCDLEYVLPGARSAVTFAVPLDASVIPPYLRKADRISLENEYIRVNALASGIAFHLANYLTQAGHPSVPVAANLVFRADVPGGPAAYVPDLAHRYLAARSGVGHFGLSGNLLTPEHGAAVILATTVTTAGLIPTAPLSAAENYCDDCRLCMAGCPSGFMDSRRTASVSLGGVEFSFSARRNYGRCDCVCSGYTGLASSGKWSTWSPGRFAIPDADEKIPAAQERMTRAHGQWPPAPGGRYFIGAPDKIRVSCAHCQLVCCPDKAERKARFRMIAESGVVVQNADGTLEAVPPEEALRRLEAMPPERRGLYEEV
jgi:epoxyqueuosine reductase QueG